MKPTVGPKVLAIIGAILCFFPRPCAAEDPRTATTKPISWPASEQRLFLSVLPLWGYEIKPCQMVKVAYVFPDDNQIWLTAPGLTEDKPPIVIVGDWRLVSAPTPAECWKELRRSATPRDEWEQEETEANAGHPVPPWTVGPPIDCRLIGRPSPCESKRSIPLLRIEGLEIHVAGVIGR